MMNAVVARIGRFAGGSRLRRNISMTLARQLLAAGAQFLTVVLIARQLGPQGNGYYAMAILVPTLLARFLNFGVGPATVYHVGRGDFGARQAARENLRMALIVAVAGIAITLPVLTIWGEQLFPDVPLVLLLIGLAAFPASLLLAYLNTILQGLEDFRAFNMTVLMPPCVTLMGVALSLFWLQAGAVGAVTAYLIGQVAGVVVVTIQLVRYARAFRYSEKRVAGRHYRKKTIGYGWKAHLSNILAFLNYRADIFLVNLFLNPAATGLYVIAVQIAERLWMLSQAASTVLLPRLSAMHDDPEGRLALTRRGFWAVSGVTTLASVVAGAALYWLIKPVFGDEYSGALPAFFWLIPGIIALAGARVQSNCIAAAGKPEWNTYVAVVVVALNVGGNILLVPKHGIVGAAWATTAAYLTNALVKQYLVQKTTAM